ncbi:hypothetical protein WICPIJ_003538 [Wickerhamomyces pijperi]|uniref:Uncharacterized protein n=1 Tax=Wickerhamomyces pijperi TaxID=599730 RepID=A0A9P8TP52_WICPI|nr:hypothetical protein WICPIJ_003538 [Wickerhamomyces pijperi]
MEPLSEIMWDFMASSQTPKSTKSRWGTWERFVGTFSLSQLQRSFQTGVVDGLEDLNVQLLGLFRFERQSQDHESIGQTLDTQGNWSVSHVGSSGFWDRVVVTVNDSVQVLGDNLGDLVQLLKVVELG